MRLDAPPWTLHFALCTLHLSPSYNPPMRPVLLLLLAAIAPALFLLHYVYVRDKYEREPLGRVLLVYCLGFLAVIPAGIWETHVPFFESLGILGVVFATWGIVAFAEEGMKFIFIRWLAHPLPEFNEVYDGVLYGTAISLGFATAENIMYVLLSGGAAWQVALLRGVLSIPAHASWGIILGYHIGLAKFSAPQDRTRLLFTGGLMAWFGHGLYDFLAYASDLPANPWNNWCAVGVVVVVIVSFILGRYYIQRAQELSVFKRPPLYVDPLGAIARVRYCHRCGQSNPLQGAFCIACGHEFPL